MKLMTLGALIKNAAERYAGNTAVWMDGASLTHAELFRRSCRLANGLAANGLARGDRIALLGPNSLQLPEQMIGITFAGMVRVVCYAHETGDVNAYMINLTECRALLVHVDQFAKFVDRLDVLKTVEKIWVYGGPSPSTEDSRVWSYEDLLAAADDSYPDIDVQPDEVHVIRFSAGTTGRPKGIVHTVGAWLEIQNQYRWVTPQLDERDSYLVAGQLSHAALLWFWQTLEVGGSLVLMSSFDAGRFLELVEERRCSVSLVVPTMISALIHHPDATNRDLSSLRCLNYAASPIAERTLTRAIEVFGEGVLYQLYASSEIPVVTMLQPYQHVPNGTEAQRRLLRSAGRPTPATEVRILGENGEVLPVGEVGEIGVRNAALMQSIWGDPEGTARRFTSDGFLLTRDMGFVDEDGFVFIADRKEDMIISGGYNIWPAEIENAIAGHPGVVNVCVVGVPDEKWGETPVAYVVLAEDVAADADAIITRTRSVLGPIKKVSAVYFVDSLPKSGVGKVIRRELRDRHWGAGVVKVGGS